MHTQRIPGAPASGPIRKVAYRMTRKRLGGRLPEPVAVAAHSTKIFGGMAAYEMALEKAKAVPERYKVLGELRAAMGRAGHAKAAGYRWDAINQAVLDAYLAVMARR